MKTLIHFKNFVDEITNNNSRKYKQSVLEKYREDEVIKKYLNIAYNPYLTFGISSKKLAKRVAGMIPYPVDVIFELFNLLETYNTGTDSIIKICQQTLEVVDRHDSQAADILEKLICKDLSIGCDSKTINSVIPNLIPTFNVQLANSYFDKPEYVKGKKFALTTKIDGHRIIALKENGQVSFYTRAGQKYEGLVDLEQEMLNVFPDNTCFDGEITLLARGKLSSKDAFKETSKIVRTKDKEKHGVKMLVFDWMPATDFKKQHCDIPYELRRRSAEWLFASVDTTYFELLPTLYVGDDISKITEILEEEVTKGEEGIMINILDAKYSFSRTNNLLKCKKFNSLDLEVVGIEEGSGRLTGALGAIHVRYKNGSIVKVGSGFSDEERMLYWLDPFLVMHRVVEVKYFEESQNADGTFSLRFPTWCSNIRDPKDKANPDY